MTGHLPLRTDRLLLRPHRPDDLEDLVRFHGDPEVVRWIPWPVRDRVATEEALRVKLDQGRPVPGEWLVLAAEHVESDTVIGEVLLKWESEADRQGELGFAFAREHQGRGYAAEASRALLRFGFDELDLHRISAVCIEQNHASARLLQHLGFRREARLVDSTVHKGEWVTQLVHALTADEWRAAGPTPAQVDQAEVLRLVRVLFAAFTSGDGTDDRLESLRDVLLPEAVVVRTCGQPPSVMGVEGFLRPRRALLTDGSLVGFSEHAGQGRVDVFGDVAHWFGRYTKDGRLHGEPCPGAGMKSVQLVRTAEGWRISAIAWDDVRPGLALEDHRAAELFLCGPDRGSRRTGRLPSTIDEEEKDPSAYRSRFRTMKVQRHHARTASQPKD